MILKSALAVAAVALLSTTALAQQRYVTFGDSLSDNGNLFIISGGTAPPGGGAPLYPSRRFSSGLVFSEILAGPMLNFPFVTPANVNAGNVNYAVGGSRTSGPMTPGPTTQQQIGLFLGAGGRFAATDVVTLWAGANNIFQGIPTAAANPATATSVMAGVANSAALDVGAQVGQLARAGARTIVVMNLPNFSGLPAYTTGAGLAANQLAGFSSNQFNQTLAGALQATAAANPGANIISVDAAGLFAATQANPASFGFANATAACVRTASCVTGNAATQNSFLFWDDVHPTEAGHRYVAALVGQYLNAPLYAGAYAALGENAVDGRRIAANRAFDRLDAARSLRPGVNAYFINVFGDAQDSNSSWNRPSSRWANGGVTFGFDRAFSADMAMTASATVGLGSLKSGGILEAGTFNAALDVAAIYNPGLFFAKLGGGFGVTRYSDIERTTLGPLFNRATATATSYNIGLELGTNHAFGAVEISPRARLTWLGASLGTIDENGIVAPVSLRSQSIGALAAAGELRASFRLVDTAQQRVSVTALIGYERYLTYTGNALAGSLVGNTALPFRTVVADPKGPGVIFGLGLNSSLGPNWTVSAEYRGSVGENRAVRHGGQLGLRASF